MTTAPVPNMEDSAMAFDVAWTDGPEEEAVFGWLRVNGKVYAVPAVPYFELGETERFQYNGPLVAALYGCERLSERAKRLCATTLWEKPDYLLKLGERMHASNTPDAVLHIVRAVPVPKSHKRKRK